MAHLASRWRVGVLLPTDNQPHRSYRSVQPNPTARTLPGCPLGVPVRFARKHLELVKASKGEAQHQSFDSEDELDMELATELSIAADPQRLKKLARHFELAWKITRPDKPQTCDCCRGKREMECNWCHGTGYMTFGDQLIQSSSGRSSTCPVCKGSGYCKCEHCRGTGSRAAWLEGGGSSGSTAGYHP